MQSNANRAEYDARRRIGGNICTKRSVVSTLIQRFYNICLPAGMLNVQERSFTSGWIRKALRGVKRDVIVQGDFGAECLASDRKALRQSGPRRLLRILRYPVQVARLLKNESSSRMYPSECRSHEDDCGVAKRKHEGLGKRFQARLRDSLDVPAETVSELTHYALAIRPSLAPANGQGLAEQRAPTIVVDRDGL